MPTVSSTHDQHVGKTIGDGHCVAYVRHVTGLPATAQWQRGDPVRGGGHAPGTAIACFGRDGKYTNRTDGSAHCAILIAERSDGLLVWDCWQGQPVHQRVIRFRNGQGNAINDGDQFYAIELAP